VRFSRKRQDGFAPNFFQGLGKNTCSLQPALKSNASSLEEVGIHSFPAWRSVLRDSLEKNRQIHLLCPWGKAFNGIASTFEWLEL